LTEVNIESLTRARLAQGLRFGTTTMVVDEPADEGGENRGPNPYQVLLGALGACTSMTLQLYARRKGWPLEHVEVRLTHDRIHAVDCADCETQDGFLDEIRKEIRVSGPLDEEQRARLLQIARRCPVNLTLQREVRIIDSLV
jgi:putative redox protein